MHQENRYTEPTERFQCCHSRVGGNPGLRELKTGFIIVTTSALLLALVGFTKFF